MYNLRLCIVYRYTCRYTVYRYTCRYTVYRYTCRYTLYRYTCRYTLYRYTSRYMVYRNTGTRHTGTPTGTWYTGTPAGARYTVYSNNNKRPLTPKSMPPTNNDHVPVWLLVCIIIIIGVPYIYSIYRVSQTPVEVCL